MADKELIERLRNRAKEDRQIQANNEAVATALQGQRLLFDQGFRSQSNTFAVRLGLDYENCAKKDAELAADWEAAADRIEELVKGKGYALERIMELDDRTETLTAKLTKAVEALRKIGKTYSADGFRLIHSDRQIINMVYIVLAELEGK